MARASAQIPVSEYAKGFPPAVRAMMSAARATVTSVAPKATETAYRGWPTRYFDDDDRSWRAAATRAPRRSSSSARPSSTREAGVHLLQRLLAEFMRA